MTGSMGFAIFLLPIKFSCSFFCDSARVCISICSSFIVRRVSCCRLYLLLLIVVVVVVDVCAGHWQLLVAVQTIKFMLTHSLPHPLSLSLSLALSLYAPLLHIHLTDVSSWGAYCWRCCCSLADNVSLDCTRQSHSQSQSQGQRQPWRGTDGRTDNVIVISNNN